MYLRYKYLYIHMLYKKDLWNQLEFIILVNLEKSNLFFWVLQVLKHRIHTGNTGLLSFLKVKSIRVS